MTNYQIHLDDRRKDRKANHQPGYSGVLLRVDLKQSLRDYRNGRGFHDSHFERCLVSACVEMGLDPSNDAALQKALASTVAFDLQISQENAKKQANESRDSARSPGLSPAGCSLPPK